MAHANISSLLFQNRQQNARVSTLPANSFLHVISSLLVSAEEGLENIFPKSMRSRTQLPKAVLNRIKSRKAPVELSLAAAFHSSDATFKLPYNKRYIDTLSLQRILSIKSGSMGFKRAHFLSIFTNRRAVIFSGSGNSEEEAKFMADIWYQEWRKEQKQKNIAVKIIEKEYNIEHKAVAFFRCELKVKYAFKIIVR